ncbi:hypothetical protein HAX54_037269 [Datura stramonium]|uniref:Senescence regulator n=1 Tax=Datura stramonium TaxID=4076 RepID=A0ABS8VI76_DATST|nr:hypothetical protein [Datura stramonium]
MATRKNKNFLFLGGGKDRITPLPPSSNSTLQFEFDEAEMWSNSEEINVLHNSEPKLSIPSSRFTKKSTKKGERRAITATSLPVNIPDWSKGNLGNNIDFDDGDEDLYLNHENEIPPHEYLARTRVASFSVHEGIGRTLKGRDLSRVRNAIWKKIGFED